MFFFKLLDRKRVKCRLQFGTVIWHYFFSMHRFVRFSMPYGAMLNVNIYFWLIQAIKAYFFLYLIKILINLWDERIFKVFTFKVLSIQLQIQQIQGFKNFEFQQLKHVWKLKQSFWWNNTFEPHPMKKQGFKLFL
jgi:hypothetical protein